MDPLPWKRLNSFNSHSFKVSTHDRPKKANQNTTVNRISTTRMLIYQWCSFWKGRSGHLGSRWPLFNVLLLFSLRSWIKRREEATGKATSGWLFHDDDYQVIAVTKNLQSAQFFLKKLFVPIPPSSNEINEHVSYPFVPRDHVSASIDWCRCSLLTPPKPSLSIRQRFGFV